jgi:hypothetical protein
MRGSFGGVTLGNGWLRNNPELDYPDGHEDMTDNDLKSALKVDNSLSTDNFEPDLEQDLK